MSYNVDDFIEWQHMATELRLLKARESKLRDKLTEQIFLGEGAHKTTTVIIGDFRVKATAKLSNRIDEAVFSAIQTELSDEELSAVKFKPSLVANMYKKLPEDTLLNEAVIMKPGKSTLSVTEV